MTGTIPAGWYPAPHANGEPRYWDGHAWQDAAPQNPVPQNPVPQNPAPQHPWSNPLMPTPVVTRPSHARWLGVTSVSAGGVAILLGWIPYVGVTIALLALATGIIALVRREPRALAVTGTVLSAVGLAVGIATTVAVTAWFADVDQSITAPWPDGTDVDEWSSGYPETGPGSFADPLPQPHVVNYGGADQYSVTARVVDQDAGVRLQEWSEYNEPAPEGERWVLVEMTVTALAPTGVKPAFADYDLWLATGDDEFSYSEWITLPDGVAYLSDDRTLDPGESFSGVAAYLVPGDAGELLLADEVAYIEF